VEPARHGRCAVDLNKLEIELTVQPLPGELRVTE
jgi:hypothetical protein